MEPVKLEVQTTEDGTAFIVIPVDDEGNFIEECCDTSALPCWLNL